MPCRAAGGRRFADHALRRLAVGCGVLLAALAPAAKARAAACRFAALIALADRDTSDLECAWLDQLAVVAPEKPRPVSWRP